MCEVLHILFMLQQFFEAFFEFLCGEGAQSVAIVLIGGEYGNRFGGQHRTSSVFAACCGLKQFETQLLFCCFDDAPCLGVGHRHGRGGGAQGMVGLHPSQKLGNARPEAFSLSEDSHGQHRSEILFHEVSIPQNVAFRQLFSVDGDIKMCYPIFRITPYEGFALSDINP